MVAVDDKLEILDSASTKRKQQKKWFSNRRATAKTVLTSSDTELFNQEVGPDELI